MQPLDPTATVPRRMPRKRRKRPSEAAAQTAPEPPAVMPSAAAAAAPVSETARERGSPGAAERLAQAIRRVLDSL